VLALLDDVPAFTRPISAPFVGRREDLDRLEQALEAAVQTRAPQLATIVGPPGIGKSRLARELIGRAQARVLVGRCLSYGEGITYWPLQEMVSQIGDVRAILGNAPDGDLAAVRMAAAIGDSDTPSTPEEIAWGARKLFEAMAAAGPLVVVFDDIHWAEPTFLDLIEYVAAFARGVPLLVLCTARADLFDQRPTWTAPRPNATVLTLEPLSAAECAVLVTDLGEAVSDTVQRIVETAEGNPLFVEQLVATLAEGGGGLEVPPTLQALLTARIDRLAEPERAVIERGSVEGRLFHRGAVAALLPEPDRAAIGGHLLTLVRKELIRPDHALVPGDDGFRFGHALIRDAAYDEIPKRQRAVLHESYAEWLASRLGDDAPEEIVVYHLEQAYRYGAELGAADPAVGERAAERLAAAGQTARARGDVRAAANLLGRASDLVPGTLKRTALLVGLGEALNTAGEFERARSVLEEATSLATAAGDDHVEWLARIELAATRLELETESGGPEVALGEAKAALAARGSVDDHAVQARAWDLTATAHQWRGEVAEWQRASERAMTHARETGDLAFEVQIVAHSAGPIVYGSVTVEEGLRYADDLLVRLGHVPEVQGLTAHVRAHMRARLGEFDGAFEGVNAWRRHIRELGQGGDVRPHGGLRLGRLPLGPGLGRRRGGAARELRDARSDGHEAPPLDRCSPSGGGRVLPGTPRRGGALQRRERESRCGRRPVQRDDVEEAPCQGARGARRSRGRWGARPAGGRFGRGCRVPGRYGPDLARPVPDPRRRGRPGGSIRRHRGAPRVRAEGEPRRRGLGTGSPRRRGPDA